MRRHRGHFLISRLAVAQIKLSDKLSHEPDIPRAIDLGRINCYWVAPERSEHAPFLAFEFEYPLCLDFAHDADGWINNLRQPVGEPAQARSITIRGDSEANTLVWSFEVAPFYWTVCWL